MTEQVRQGRAFEDEVREVARALWNLEDGGPEFIDGDEVDIVCRTEDIVHLVECTTDRSLNKTDRDINKLVKVKRSQERAGRTVKLWMVTKDDPTAEQRTTARNDGVTMLSFKQFRSRLIDANPYLNCRSKYRFGSATDPATGTSAVPSDEYVPLPITDVTTGLTHTVQSMADLLLDGKTIILVGPFGAGKSLTVREVFLEMRRRFLSQKIECLPLALNLREHWGQEDVSEALHRHAKRIGFAKPEQLVRAWHTGQLLVLLDGFDELSSQALSVSAPAMRANRRNAVTLIREFVDGSRRCVGLLIAGRSHYFDTSKEMVAALGLPQDAVELELSEFTDEQARAYLAKKKIALDLPEWLPRKPLLLSYLATKGLLNEVLGIDSGPGLAFAWDQFIAKICLREAALARDIEAEAVRHLLEILATKTRESASGTGPLTEQDMADAYKAATGYEPLEPARVLLARLPGLTSRDQQVGTRSFVDGDMLDTLRAGSVARFVQNPYQSLGPASWGHPLGELGYAVAALKASQMSLPQSKHQVAANEAIARWGTPVLALDSLMSGARRAMGTCLECGGIRVSKGIASTIDLEDHPLSELSLDSCWIELLRLGEAVPQGLTFTNCVIERIEGVSDESGVPAWITRSEISAFDDATTVSAMMDLGLPMPTRVLLTVVHKLFEQRGRGRVANAFMRGIEPAARPFVEPILDILRSEGVAFSVVIGGRTPVWHPRRTHQARMRQIAASPKTSMDPILVRVRQLS